MFRSSWSRRGRSCSTRDVLPTRCPTISVQPNSGGGSRCCGLKPAITNLEFATQIESNNPFGWQLLAIAYGRNNQIGVSDLAQAERAMANGNKREARTQAN